MPGYAPARCCAGAECTSARCLCPHRIQCASPLLHLASPQALATASSVAPCRSSSAPAPSSSECREGGLQALVFCRRHCHCLVPRVPGIVPALFRCSIFCASRTLSHTPCALLRYSHSSVQVPGRPAHHCIPAQHAQRQRRHQFDFCLPRLPHGAPMLPATKLCLFYLPCAGLASLERRS